MVVYLFSGQLFPGLFTCPVFFKTPCLGFLSAWKGMSGLSRMDLSMSVRLEHLFSINEKLILFIFMPPLFGRLLVKSSLET